MYYLYQHAQRPLYWINISNEKVANEPTFKELAKEIFNIIKDCDLAGFNSDRFDIPLLAEEMLRSEIDFDLKNMLSDY